MFALFTASPALLVCAGSAVTQGAPLVFREPQGALHSWNATWQGGVRDGDKTELSGSAGLEPGSDLQGALQLLLSVASDIVPFPV